MTEPARQSPKPMYASPYFMVIVALYVTSLITANTVATKVLEIGPWVTDAGLITFPIAYIVGDVLTEVYGYAAARRVIWLGFACNLIAVATFQLAGVLPAESTWQNQSAYDAIFGSTPRLLLASFCAYLIGEFANAIVLAKLKVLTEGRWLWMRTIGSTIVGQGLDSVVFVLIAFGGVFPTGVLQDMVVTNWVLKTAYETVMTPVTYLVVNKLKEAEGVDVFDRDTDFSPIAVGG